MTRARISDLYPTDEREDEPMVTQERPPYRTQSQHPDEPTAAGYGAAVYQKLATATETMRRIESDREEQRRELSTMQRLLGERLADLAADVCDETTLEGKPRFTNDAARKAETSRRARRDPQAMALQNSVDAADVEIARLSVDFDFQRRTRANLLAALEFQGKQLAYYSTYHAQEDSSR